MSQATDALADELDALRDMNHHIPASIHDAFIDSLDGADQALDDIVEDLRRANPFADFDARWRACWVDHFGGRMAAGSGRD